MQTIKILIMGLDNSGKTSIILSLMKETNLLSYYSLKPTQGVNIVNIGDQGTSYNIWDFGGQEQYRDEYLRDIDKYTKDVDRVIYVIDVQDEKRYDLALQYLASIIKALNSKAKQIEFSVYLHKFDPQFEMRSSFHKKVDAELISKIKKIIPSHFNCKIYKTTIYTIFKRNLVP